MKKRKWGRFLSEFRTSLLYDPMHSMYVLPEKQLENE